MDVTEEEKQKIRDKIAKLKESKFKQQTLPAWRPVPTALSTLLTFSIFSVVFIGIGIILLSLSNEIREASTPYDAACAPVDPAADPSKTCELTLEVPEDLVGDVYVYYQLENFYQNHRRYVKSRDNSQLAGTYAVASDLSGCNPIQKVGDLWSN